MIRYEGAEKRKFKIWDPKKDETQKRFEKIDYNEI